MSARRITLSVLTLLLAAITHAAFNLPAEITVSGRIDNDGSLRTDVVQDGEETAPISGTTGAPVLLFSDLINGPDTGLGDGLGSGVIVTVWGQHLGTTQASSVIEYCDSASVCRTGHVYYWKNADGTLPSGPANLHESHGMQEIAFSIPDSEMGVGTIRVRVGLSTTTLPFTVRTGRILHVRSNGNDNNSGTFASPLLTVDRADARGFQQVGDIIYIHGVVTGGATSTQGIFNDSFVRHGEANNNVYTSYPNTLAIVRGANGFNPYDGDGHVVSKIKFESSNCNATGAACFTSDSSGIGGSDMGRAIANVVTDQANGCVNSQGGAISTGITTGVDNMKIYGNMVHDYGCPQTTRMHHTTYFTIRDVYAWTPGDSQFRAPEVAYNYLKNNHAQYGIHYYDEDLSGNNGCGDLTTDLRIHDNVIMDQAGPALSYQVNCGYTQDTYIYNNLVIRGGHQANPACTTNCAFIAAGIQLADAESFGILRVYNNLVYEWDPDNLGTDDLGTCFNFVGDGNGGQIRLNDNICYSAANKPFYGNSFNSAGVLSNITGANNLFYTAIGSNQLPPFLTGNIASDPLLTLTGSRISVGAVSPIVNASSTTLPRDIYGVLRASSSNIGPVNGSQ